MIVSLRNHAQIANVSFIIININYYYFPTYNAILTIRIIAIIASSNYVIIQKIM